MADPAGLHGGPDSPSLQRIRASLVQARTALDNLLRDDETLQAIERTAQMLCDTFKAGGRVYSCGNGGSMSDAMHFAEELTGRFREDRPGLPAQAISDVGHLTCVANDFGYDQVFSRYVTTHGRAGDCLLAISTSGRSANVVAAAQAAKRCAMRVIALTGRAECDLAMFADIVIATPGGTYADRVQELHIKVIHILLELIETDLFPLNDVLANSKT